MLRRLTILIFLLYQVILSNAQVISLDDFIHAGLSNSPLLKDLNNQIRMNSVDSLLIKANRLPQIKFNGMMMYAPIINDYGYSQAITNGGNLISVIQASQNIFNNKTIEAQYRKVWLQHQSLSNSCDCSSTRKER